MSLSSCVTWNRQIVILTLLVIIIERGNGLQLFATGPQQPVLVGTSATLLCSYSPFVPNVDITWSKTVAGAKSKTVITKRNGRVSNSVGFDRMSFEPYSQANMVIRDVTMQDSGTYICEVTEPGYYPVSAEATLKVTQSAVPPPQRPTRPPNARPTYPRINVRTVNIRPGGAGGTGTGGRPGIGGGTGTGGINPGTGGFNPGAGGAGPGTGGFNPGAGGAGPGTGGFNPGAGGAGPGTGGFNPGAGGAGPGTGGFNPGAGAGPGTGGFNPGTGGTGPGTGGFNPGTGGTGPGTGGFNPGTGGFNPGTGGFNPGTGDFNPGTGGFNPGNGGFNPGNGGFGPGGVGPGTGRFTQRPGMGTRRPISSRPGFGRGVTNLYGRDPINPTEAYSRKPFLGDDNSSGVCVRPVALLVTVMLILGGAFL